MNSKIKTYLEIILSFPKTLIFNLQALPLKQALHLPVFVHYNTKLINIHRGVLKLGKAQTGMVRFGFGGTYGIQPSGSERSLLEFGTHAEICFMGRARFAKGTTIRVGGGITFGENFSSNRNCLFSCNDKITIGDRVLLGWNVSIRDSDNHTVLHKGSPKPSHAEVKIGSHVWLCSYVDVLKGVIIPDESVVGYRALVTKQFSEPHTLIAGIPATVVQKDIDWER